LRIDGEVHGDVLAVPGGHTLLVPDGHILLVISENARVLGKVKAEHVMIKFCGCVVSL